jgi:hypothetical protein
MHSYIKSALLFAVVFFVSSINGWAQDVSCPDPAETGGGKLFKSPFAYVLPTSDERHEVQDFISQYAWLMDNQIASGIRALFLSDGRYLVCANVADVKVPKPRNPAEVESDLSASFKGLAGQNMRARRVFSNILIRKNPSDQTFEAIISAVVFTQSTLAAASDPKPDYMASLYMTIARDSIAGNSLKIQSLIVLSDPKGISIFAR